MRVLQAVHHFVPRHRAGVEVHTDRVARALMARGEEVAVVTTDDDHGRPGAIREHDQDGLRVFTINHGRLAPAPEATLGDGSTAASFARVLDRFPPDVVHFQHLMYLGLDAPGIAKARGAGTVLTLHEYWLLCARGGQFLMEDGTRCASAVPEICARCLETFKFGRTRMEARIAAACRTVRRWTGMDPFPWLKRLRERKLRKKSPRRPVWQEAPSERMLSFLESRRTAVASARASLDRILAPSRFLMRKFNNAGWPPDRFLYWPNGVETSPGSQESWPLPPGDGPLRVGYVGSIMPQKGLDVLLRAHQRLPEGQLRIRIFGSGAERPSYLAEVKALARPGETEFMGPFPAGRSEEAFRWMDVLVVPSVWYENAPLVISEAFAHGVPVVASRLGGMAELVADGVDGVLFEPGDDADLAHRLSRLSADPEEVARLALGVRPPRSLADDVEGLRALYRTLGGESR